jgi:putative membrane protein
MAASAPAVAAAAAYLGAVARVGRWPRPRTAAFLVGLALLVVAQLPQLDDRLPGHMLGHLLVTTAAAPAIVAGAPLTLALRASRGSWRATLARAVRGATLHTLTRPVVAWSLFAASLTATHVPVFYDLALREPGVHAVEHALYLWTAILFWTPLLAAPPLRHRLGGAGAIAYLLLAMVPMSLVGVWLLSAETVVYPHYAALGASALADQRAGATVMWLGGTVALVVAVVACGWSALVREEARAREARGRAPVVAGGRR